MKNTTWVFGSMLAAGCMLLSVPVGAQGNFPQGMQGMQGMPGGMGPGGFPQQAGAPGFPQAGAPGRANPAAGAKPATTDKTNSAAKNNNTAKNEKAALEAAKYQLSNHRADLIKTTIDGYASSEDLTDPAIVRAINADIEKHMGFLPSRPYADTQCSIFTSHRGFRTLAV